MRRAVGKECRGRRYALQRKGRLTVLTVVRVGKAETRTRTSEDEDEDDDCRLWM
eukprot:COSAG04_NODE_21370_length_375_cov_0.557971_2_plen_53_part_01